MLTQLKKTLGLDDVAILPRYSAQVNSIKVLTLDTDVFKGIPVFSSHRDSVGTIEMANLFSSKNMGTFLSPRYDNSELYDFFFEGNDLVIPSFGVTESQIHKWNEFKGTLPAGKIKGVNLLPRTTAHDIKYLYEVGKFRDENPDVKIFAGPVSDPYVAARLIEVGANVVKVGYDYRTVIHNMHTAGVGIGHATALIDCVEAVNQRGGMVMASGYYDDNADLCKCFALGADFVELYETLIGHEECHGKTTTEDGVMMKNDVVYRGSAYSYADEILSSISECMIETGSVNISELKDAKMVLV